MTVLVFEAAAAGAGVVSPNVLVHADRHPGALFPVCGELRGIRAVHLLEVAVGLGSRARLTGIRGIPERDECAEKERQDFLVEFFKHLREEVVALKLVHHQRVFLLIGGVLDALTEIVHIPQVLLPVVIYIIEDDAAAEGLRDFTAFSLICLLEVH